MGRQTGEDDPRFATHENFYESMKRIHEIMLIENVPEYKVSIAVKHLGSAWELESTVIDPRHFGVPASRARLYILAWRRDKVKRRDDGVWFGGCLCDSVHIDSLS